MGSVRNPITGANAFIPSGDSLGALGGDYTGHIIFTGWNGSDVANFNLIRNINRKYNIYRSTTIFVDTVGSFFFSSIGGTAGDRILNISCGSGDDASTSTVPIGEVGNGRWFLFSVNVSSWVELFENTARVYVNASGSITPSDGIGGGSFDVTGSTLHTFIYNVNEWSYGSNFGAGGGIFYDRPYYFYMVSLIGANASFAYIGYEQGPPLSSQEMASLANSFRGTFVDYSGPCWIQ